MILCARDPVCANASAECNRLGSDPECRGGVLTLPRVSCMGLRYTYYLSIADYLCTLWPTLQWNNPTALKYQSEANGSGLVSMERGMTPFDTLLCSRRL
jgi:hypothetical protein